MKRNSVLYAVLFVGALCGVAYLSIPSESTLVEMSRDDVDTARTEQLLERRFSREPDSVAAALELADFLLESGKPEESARVLAKIHASHPGDASVQERYGLALLRDGDVEAALSVVPEARRNRTFLLAASDNYEKRGDLANAEAMLLKAEAGLPEDAGVWKTIAQWRWDMYEMDAAAEALRRALRLRPNDVDALERYYTNRVWQLDAAEAIAAAARLEKIKPLDRMHLNALYGMEMSIRDIDGAAETLRKIAALPDATAEDAFALGVFLYQKGDVAGSDEVFLDLAQAPGVPLQFLNDAASRLEYSAIQHKNLELAKTLVDLTDIPEIVDSSRHAVVDIAMELGRFDVAAKHIAMLIANPDAAADVLETGLELAYRTDDFAALPGLHERVVGAGVSIDTLFLSLPQDDRPLDEWLAATAAEPGRAYAMAGWLKTALRLKAEAETDPTLPDAATTAEIAGMTERLLPLIDARAILVVAEAVEALAYLAEALPDAGRQQASLERAAELIDTIDDGVLADSAAFMLLAAGVNERLGRMDAAEALWRRAALASAADPWSRLGLARAAAAKGDPAPVEAAIRHFEERGELGTASELRGLVYACLNLADGFQESEPAEAERWLLRARTLADTHAPLLAAADIENLILTADLAERMGEPEETLAAWNAVAAREPESARTLLGLARANIALERADPAWEALRKVEALVGNAESEQRLQLAWQFFAVADATPGDSPSGKERRAFAFAYAESALESRWDANLSQSLFWRALEARDLDRAKAHAARQANAPELHAALAEAYLAAENADGALSEAVLAAESTDRAVLLRMAYVFSQLERAPEAKRLLVRVEQAGGEETPEYLLQLADAYGAVEDYGKQYELAEKRARTGGVPEWLDAVDRRTWSGDNAGGLELLAEARERHPASVELADRAITLLADVNRPGEATDVFMSAGRVIDGLEDKLSADALAALGVSYDDLRSTPRARRFFRLALEKDAGIKRGRMGFARLLRRDGNFAAAIMHLRRYVEAAPDDAWGWLELANTRVLASRNARPDYRKVIDLTEPDAKGDIPEDVRAARAVALRSLGREKEALALLRGTVGPRPNNPDVACDYAQMLMEIGQFDEAERVLRETVAAFPYHVWAYRLEATILVRRQKYDLAVARLKEALVWSPHDGEVRRDLGFAAQLWERTWDAQKGWLTAGGR